MRTQHPTIPAPPSLPLIGHLNRIDLEAPVSSLVAMAADQGALFRVELPTRELIVLTRHELVAEACDTSRFTKMLSGPLEQIRAIAGRGLFTAHGTEPEWGRAHRILMPAFGPDAVDGYHDRMVDIAEQLAARWARFGPAVEHDVADQMTRLTLDTIALCGFDYRFNSFYGSEMHPFVDAMMEGLREAGVRAQLPASISRLRWRANRQLAENVQIIDDVVGSVVRARREQPDAEATDLLGLMMAGRDPLDGSQLTDDELRDQIVTFLIAGHETTSGLLSFALRAMLRDPAVLARARAEVDAVLGDAPAPTPEQIRELVYLDQILRETLRLWPTAPAFALTPIEPTLLAGAHPVSPGDELVVLIPALHRDPEIWPDPERFDPDRFAPERRADIPVTAWRPFGNGARACIGRPFAMHEALLVLSVLLRRFDLEDVAPDAPLVFKETLTIKPADFRIRVRERADAPTGQAARTSAPAPAPAPARTAPAHGTPVLVLYGSNSGTCAGMARRLAATAEARGWAPTVASMDDGVDALPVDGPVLIVTASYNGEPPDNAAAFVRWAEGLAPGALAGVRFGVLGVGHPDWARTFMAIPRRVDAALSRAGAERLVDRGEADVSRSARAVEESWSSDAWPRLAASFGVADVDPAAPRLTAEAADAPPDTVAKAHGAAPMPVTVAEDLTAPGSPAGRRKVRVVLSLPDEVTYSVGDHLLVLPENAPEQVARAAARASASPEDWLVLKGSADAFGHLPLGQPARLGALLSGRVELADPPTPAALLRLAALAPCPPDAMKLRALAAPERYAAEVEARRLSLLDVLDTVPSVQIDAATLLTLLPPMRPRRYSIASSPRLRPREAELCVAVLDAPARSGAGRFQGAASGFLGRVQPGDTVRGRVTPCGKPFAPPEDASRPMVLVAAGSGIAPFIGFLEELEARAEAGEAVAPALLLFGCDHPDRDRIYGDRLDAWQASGLLTTRCAYDQLPEPSPHGEVRWVQHRLRAEQAAVRERVAAGGVVYVCGDGRRMAPAVRETLAEILGTERFADLIAGGRYLEDVFA